MSYNFNYDDQLTLNNNDSVMVDVMTMDDILLEILENKTGYNRQLLNKKYQKSMIENELIVHKFAKNYYFSIISM